MNMFIVMFLPCIIGPYVYEKLTKKTNFKEFSYIYLIECLFANIIVGIILVKKQHVNNFQYFIENNFSISLKCMILSLFLCLLFSVILAIIKKYFKFEMDVINGRNEKK